MPVVHSDEFAEFRKSVLEVFARIDRCFPGTILAGGYIRSLAMGVLPNDLDFFVPFMGSPTGAAELLLREGLGSLVLGESDYHGTRQEIKTSIDINLNWGEGSRKLKALTVYRRDLLVMLEIILSPVTADQLVSWFISHQEIPLNTGYMRVDGVGVIPEPMQADLDDRVVTLLEPGTQRSRAEHLSKRFNWPMRENVV